MEFNCAAESLSDCSSTDIVQLSHEIDFKETKQEHIGRRLVENPTVEATAFGFGHRIARKKAILSHAGQSLSYGTEYIMEFYSLVLTPTTRIVSLQRRSRPWQFQAALDLGELSRIIWKPECNVEGLFGFLGSAAQELELLLGTGHFGLSSLCSW
jgi:hypothetical protein